MNGLVVDAIRALRFSGAFICEAATGKVLSYEAFFERAFEIAEYLGKIRAKNLVFIEENSYRLAYIYFAAMFMDKPLCVIDPQKGKDEMAGILSSVSDSCMVRFASTGRKLPVSSNMEVQILPEDFFEREARLTDSVDIKEKVIGRIVARRPNIPYLITYTSGTSGATKGVVHSLENLLCAALALEEKVHVPPHPVFMHLMPMTYMAGILNSLFYPFLAGARIIICSRFSAINAHHFWRIASKYGANLFWVSPSMITLIQKTDRGDVGEKYCAANDVVFLVGTAPLNETVRRRFQEKYKARVYASYGLTETLFISIETDSSISRSRGNAVGGLLDKVTVKLDGNGEILLNVPWMFLRYTNEDTGRYFRKEYYCSGDIGEIFDQNLYITGRNKDLVIKGGMNYSPVLIENVILEDVDAVAECAIIGVRNTEGEEKICCVYKTERDHSQSLQGDIRKATVARLGKNYFIDHFWQVSEIKKNINGKVDRNYLREIWERDHGN